MKTTIDAVNEFKGEWATDDEMDPVTHIVMANINSGEYLKGELKVARGAVGNYYWKVICSHEEFNNLVLRLSSNFGKSISYETYKQSWKETSMIYTQEMADNDVLPSVGMKFIDSKDSNQIVNTCLFINKGEVVYSFGLYFGLHSYQSAILSECKPLPPVKTETEIAQEKQVIDTAAELSIEYCNVTDIALSYETFISSARHLQEKGMLAEIILPVKG